MNSPWAKLPNAHHIDWVIESVKQNPQLWCAAWDNETWFAAWDSARDRVWDAARAAAGDLVWGAAWDADFGRGAAWDAILALVAYDDCDQYLNMGYEKLLLYAILSERPQALLLLPMIYVKEKLNDRMVTLT